MPPLTVLALKDTFLINSNCSIIFELIKSVIAILYSLNFLCKNTHLIGKHTKNIKLLTRININNLNSIYSFTLMLYMMMMLRYILCQCHKVLPLGLFLYFIKVS